MIIKKILIFGLIIFSFGLGIGYVYTKFVNSKITSDAKTYFKKYTGQILVISWDKVTTGVLLDLLNKDQETGKFPEISSNILAIEKYRFPNPFFVENHNFGYIELFLAQVQSGIYQDLNVQPYKTVSTYKTNINGEDYYLIIQRWVNNDESISFVPIITSNLIDYSDFIYNNSKYFPSPIVEIKDIETCLILNGAGKEYCNWYFDNIINYNEIRDKWLTTSIIPSEIAKFPILVTKTPLKI